MGAKAPTQARGLGAADAPSGVQGLSKMNLMFDIAKNWLSLSILNKFLKWMADKK